MFAPVRDLAQGHVITRTQFTTAGESGLRLWDLQARTLVKEIQRGEAPLTRAAWSADGGRLAAALTDGRVLVWDAASGALEREIAVGQDLVWSIAFSADGKRLATGSADEVVVVWDIESGSRFTSLTGHSGGATDVAFPSDGATLTAVDRNGRSHFWDLQTGRRLIELWPAHRSASWRIAIHPDGERFATAGDDGYVRVWDDLSVERACELSRDAFHGIRRSEYFGNADDVLACTSFVNNSGTNR